MTAAPWLRDALHLRSGESPFPWQEELLRRFKAGTIERSLDIPTGLGKTAVMAIWLVARAQGAPVPRRLVYVVDRRAVVDQATDTAEGLRRFVEENAAVKRVLGLEGRTLPISTLRGQHVDNREWLDDPALPAIIVGTVDMIGSRLLFQGYGTSRKMRPYHAGLIGADTLVVLDEAHLVPPFDKLLRAIADDTRHFGPGDEQLRRLIPPFKLLALSATGRSNSEATSFGLQSEDERHPVVSARLRAPKHLSIQNLHVEAKLESALAEQAWALTDKGERPLRLVVYCDSRKTANAVKQIIEGLAKAARTAEMLAVELFVGGRRIFERERAAAWLEEHGFIAGSKVEITRPAFVIATSAGEVGVDLDADHMVSDLVAWERMIQRLGRVNRRGEGDARVVVITEPPGKDAETGRGKPAADRNSKERRAIVEAERNDVVHKLFERLPTTALGYDASPWAFRAMKRQAVHDPELRDLIDRATTPAPLRPELTRALVDAWSMTSLREHTGRPEIQPWLRGWIEEEPQTTVIWRTYLPLRTDGHTTAKAIEDFFESASPHTSEVLETTTFEVVDWLTARVSKRHRQKTGRRPTEDRRNTDAARAHDQTVAIVLTSSGDVEQVLRVRDLDSGNGGDPKRVKDRKQALMRLLMNATLIVDAAIAGLAPAGLLDATCDEPPRTIDDGQSWPAAPFRIEVRTATDPDTGNARNGGCQFPLEVSDEGEPLRWLFVENASTEEQRSTGRPQLLDAHQLWTERRVRDIGRRVGLPGEYIEVLAIAARLHDEGKRAKNWQRAFNAKSDGPYAKTRGPLNVALLDGYRHEFGSLPAAEGDPAIRRLPEDLQDLALHLIAAHHGFGRPVISVTGCEGAPPSTLEDRASRVALRFVHLQRRWGPWGLAWWESLLRAADQQASRANDAADVASSAESS